MKIDCHQSGMTYRKSALKLVLEMINRQITPAAEKSPFKEVHNMIPKASYNCQQIMSTKFCQFTFHSYIQSLFILRILT